MEVDKIDIAPNLGAEVVLPLAAETNPTSGEPKALAPAPDARKASGFKGKRRRGVCIDKEKQKNPIPSRDSRKPRPTTLPLKMR